MVYNEDDKLVSVLGVNDVEFTPVLFNETAVMPYIAVRKGWHTWTFNESLEEYINITFKHRVIDWDKPSDERYKN